LERISVFLTSILFIGGAIGGYFNDPLWLNRCGSLIIVVAVVVAAIKLKDILGQQIQKFVEKNEPAQLALLYEAYEKFWGGKIPEDFKANLTRDVREKTESTFSAYIEKRVGRVKRVEISLLVIGTLTNGFGDVLVNYLRAAIA
jgi:hypothetical protein